MSRFFWATFLFLCLGVAVSAQSSVGGASLSGTITDPSGSVVGGATVKLASPDTGFVRNSETNSAGIYTFIRVPVGQYSLEVSKAGFRPLKQENITLNVGASASLDLQLTLGSTTETVTVSSELPLVESTKSETSTVVNSRAVADMPVNGRNFLDFTLLTPGVNRDPRGGDLSFGGQRGPANSLLMDGMDQNNLFFGQSTGRTGGGRNPYSFSQDSVQEFQVNTNGYAPEIGRAGGGVINVVTKSGTNDWHGNAFWFYRDRELNANTWINNSRGIPRQPYHYNQFGGTVGGPIVQNKLFFFLNYDGQRNQNPNPVFYPFIIQNPDALTQQGLNELNAYLTPYTTGLNNDIGLAKVDWNISNTARLSGRINIHRFQGQNFENSGPRSAQEHTGNSNVSTTSVAINYNQTFGSRTVYDGRFNWVKDDEPGLANSDAPEAQVFQNGQAYLTIGRNNFSPRYTNTQAWQTIQTVSILAGRHSLKFGGDVNIINMDNYFPGNFSGSFQFNSVADYAARRAVQLTQAFAGAGTSGPLTNPNVKEWGFFVQDQWRVTPKLTLTYGWRYDLWQFAQPAVLNPNPQLVAGGFLTNRINTDTNNNAGRFGFAYRLNESGKQMIRGGYGIFYGRTPSILIGTAMSQNGIQVQTYSLRVGVPTYPTLLPAPPPLQRTPAIYVVDPQYVQPLTAQYNFQYEAQLAENIAVTAGFLGVRGYHLTRTRDVNLYPESPETAFFSTGAATQIWTRPARRPNPDFDRISVFDSGGDSTYYGGFVQVAKRFSQNVQLLANYTYSKVVDSVPDATSVVVGTGDDAKVAQNTVQPNVDRAVGDSDITNRFVVSGLWDISYYKGSNLFMKGLVNGWQLSGIYNVRSGQVYSLTVGGNADINLDGNSRTDRPPYLGRNSNRLPRYVSLDMRVTKIIPLGTERVKMQLIGEAFNITNTMSVSAVNRSPYNFNAATRIFSPVANYGTISNVYDPRILQLAARIDF